jgi:hypothetical protein
VYVNHVLIKNSSRRQYLPLCGSGSRKTACNELFQKGIHASSKISSRLGFDAIRFMLQVVYGWVPNSSREPLRGTSPPPLPYPTPHLPPEVSGSFIWTIPLTRLAFPPKIVYWVMLTSTNSLSHYKYWPVDSSTMSWSLGWIRKWFFLISRKTKLKRK